MKLAILCVKSGPHFKQLKNTCSMIPEFIFRIKFIGKHVEEKLKINDMHHYVMTNRVTLSSNKI